MALTNDQITAQNFKDFYDQIYPYLGQGGEGGTGGHTIQDDGVDMTARDNLNFVGMEVDDNSEDGSTDVAEHRLTSSEISEMMGGIPNPTPRYPIMFDERGTEYKVGWYILSNGTKKPVYERSDSDILVSRSPSSFQQLAVISDMETMIDCTGTIDCRSDGDVYSSGEYLRFKQRGNVLYQYNASLGTGQAYIAYTIRYTKTTDTPV